MNERSSLNVSTAAVRRALVEMGHSREKGKVYQATPKLCLMFRQADRRAIEQNEDAPAADLSHTGFENCPEQLVSVYESTRDRRAASNPTPPPTAGTTTPLQPTQFVPGATSFHQHGGPAIVQAPPAITNPFYGPSPLEFQIGYGIRTVSTPPSSCQPLSPWRR